MKRIDPRRLVFIDEAAAHTAMSRTHAWIQKGKELIDPKPACHWHQLTMVGAVALDGWRVFTTSWQTMNKLRFVDWVRNKLCPRLRPGDVVVLDNLRAHHAVEVRQLVRAVGARLKFLPPYSPDFNPIESCWALLKKELRRRAVRAKDALRAAARAARFKVSSNHVVQFARHSGYRLHASDHWG